MTIALSHLARLGFLPVVALVAACGHTAAPSTIFTARKIITMDPTVPVGTAVLVRDGRIVAVGSEQELQSRTSGQALVDRTFEEMILTPGFVDPHQHPILGGLALIVPSVSYYEAANPYGPPSPGQKTKEEVIAKLQELDRKMSDQPEQVLFAWGYDVVAQGGSDPRPEKRWLTKEDLDRVSKTRPIIVESASEHDAYVNSAAIDHPKLQINEHLDVNGVQKGPDGKSNGVLIGLHALRLTFPLILPTVFPQIENAMRFVVDLNRQAGVTTMGELALGFLDLDTELREFSRFFDDPSVPERIAIVSYAPAFKDRYCPGHNDNPRPCDAAIDAVQALAERNSDKVIFQRSVKYFSDDAFVSPGMQILPPPYQQEAYAGVWLTQPEALVPSMLPWWKAGFDIHVHTNGDLSQEKVLDALEELRRASAAVDQRFVMEHLALVTDDEAERMSRLGALASMNGYYLYYRGALNVPALGEERSFDTQPQKRLLDRGVRIGIHSDTPVAPPQPLLAMQSAITRRGIDGGVMHPEAGITLDEALRAVTIDAAVMIHLEDQVGSITPGKYADFAVLREDPYAVPAERLAEIGVWGTVFNGEKVPAH